MPRLSSGVGIGARNRLGSKSPPPAKHLKIEVPIVHSLSNRINKPASDSADATAGVPSGTVAFDQKYHQAASNSQFPLPLQTSLFVRTPAAPTEFKPQPAGISSTVLRANRFTPTPWPDSHGGAQIVRYKVPVTLQAKIRAAITQWVPARAEDSDSSSSSWQSSSLEVVPTKRRRRK